MTRPRIALASAAEFAGLDASDRAGRDALLATGADARVAVWNDPSVDWRAFDAVILRSCWDYHEHHEAFAQWIAHVEQSGVPMWNPPPLLRWNMHKRYLSELASRGARIVPTAWEPRGSKVSLEQIVRAHGWSDVVVKPAISNSGRRTWRASRVDLAAREHDFAALLAERDLMVQRFMPEIGAGGEWSLVFLDGAFSHSVRKVAAAGEFRVQNEHGGVSYLETAPSHVVRSAEAILSLVREPWLYARVDGCVSDGAFHLMELEMLEPSLFLDLAEGAATRFAAAVRRLID